MKNVLIMTGALCLIGCVAVVGDTSQYVGFTEGNTQDVACTEPADCDLGYTCVTYGSASARCSAYCGADSDCPSGRPCLRFEKKKTVTTKAGQTIEVGSCAPNDPPCNPVGTSGGCASGEKCHVFDNDYTSCVKVSSPSVANGGACEYINDCVQGSACIGSDANGYYCRVLCMTGSPSCATGTTCTTLSVSVASDDIGYCKP